MREEPSAVTFELVEGGVGGRGRVTSADRSMSPACEAPPIEGDIAMRRS